MPNDAEMTGCNGDWTVGFAYQARRCLAMALSARSRCCGRKRQGGLRAWDRDKAIFMVDPLVIEKRLPKTRYRASSHPAAKVDQVASKASLMMVVHMAVFLCIMHHLNLYSPQLSPRDFGIPNSFILI
jgi:hypothetical protein